MALTVIDRVMLGIQWVEVACMAYLVDKACWGVEVEMGIGDSRAWVEVEEGVYQHVLPSPECMTVM